MSDRLTALAPTAENYFLLRTYEAVLRLKAYVAAVAEPLFAGHGRFLTAYEDEIRDLLGFVGGGSLLEAWRTRLEGIKPLVSGSPLMRLEAAVGLSGVDAFLIAGLPEEDSRFGVLFESLHGVGTRKRPSYEILTNILQQTYRALPVDGSVRRLVSAGFLHVANDGSPRSEWLLSVPNQLWDAARGETPGMTGALWTPPAKATSLESIIAPDSLKHRVREIARKVRDREIDGILLRGSTGSDKTRIAEALAFELGAGTVALAGETLDHLDPKIGPLCVITGSIPLISLKLSPGETRPIQPIPGYVGPYIVTIGSSGGVDGPPFEKSIELTLPWPEIDERVRCWQAELGVDRATAETFDRRFTLPTGHIRTVSDRAATLAEIDRHHPAGSLSFGSAVEIRHVREACRALNRQLLDELADPVLDGGTWDELVVPETTLIRLHELELRCLYRDRLNQHLGPAFSTRSQRGVRALFTGPSGTGKTLAAQILATELDIDLFRVNLAAVVDKFVGEMEKRLDRLLSVAEELDVVLLIDEGDSILGKRTSVRTANDRFANTGTNFLLQKLESYRGMVLVTSNAPDAIDPGFERRMDIVVDFHPPGPEERLRIWCLHLPASHRVGLDYLESVALRCPLTGGQIRNAALHAALLSMQDGTMITRRHLEMSVRSEYLKQGATLPAIGSESKESRSGMRSFVDSGVALA